MQLEFGKATISVANMFDKESAGVYDSDTLFSNIDKALEIAERSMVVDYTNIEIKTSVDNENGYRIIADVTVSGLIFGDIPVETTEVPVYDVYRFENPIEIGQKISEQLIMTMINDWLEEAGEEPVDIDTPDADLTEGQKRAIIAGIINNYTDEEMPEEMTTEEINKALWAFGFRFNADGDDVEDEE